jgi:hypothetical protein
MRKVALSVLILMAFASAGVADTILTPVTVTYTGAGVNQWNGYWAYPYYFQMNGSGPSVAMLCDDYADDIQAGESWSAVIVPLTSSNLVKIASGQLPSYFGQQPSGLSLYEQAGYIFSRILSGQYAGGSGNAAIWKLFTPSVDISGDATAQQILATSSAWAAGLNGTVPSFDNVAILAPDLTKPVTNPWPATGRKS